MRFRGTKAVLLSCMVLSAAVILIMAQETAQTNPASRLATIESLAHRGTFAIDESNFAFTCDKVLIDGHYYSSKPPMLSVISTGAYLAFSELTGISFSSNEPASIRFLSILMGGVPCLVLLFYFYLFMRRLFESDRTIKLGLLVFTLNFIGLGYATTLNNHTPAAACIFISFYYSFLLREGRATGKRYWLLAGFLAGLGATFELWAGLFCVAFLAYLGRRDIRRSISLFLPAALLPVAVHFLLTEAATGSFLPVYLRSDLYRFSEGYWLSPTGIDALNEPKHIYFFNILLGHHGLFSMTPVFILSFWSIIAALKRKGRMFSEALVIGIPVVAALLFLGFRTRNYGGICAGFRWMIFSMPLLFLFTADWIDRHRSRAWMILLIVFTLIGLVMLGDVPWAKGGPWHNSAWHKQIFGLY